MKKIITLLLVLPLFLTGCSIFPFSNSGIGSSSSNDKGVFKTGDKGTTWIERNDLEDGGRMNRLNAKKMAFDIFDTNILYLATNKGFYISENGADSWKAIMSDASISDFILNPKTRGIIYVASGKELYKTVDNGENWDLIYTEARSDVTISSIAISHFDTSYIYILTSDGILMMSSDWGESWQQTYNFKTKTSKILINPNNSQDMYVVHEKGLYQSVDEGKTWTDILAEKNKDYPGIEQFTQLSFTDEENDLIYLSKYGILKSQDKGTTWSELSLITPSENVSISAMSFNKENKDEIYYIVNNILYQTLDNGRNWKTKVVPINSRAKASQILLDYQDSNIFYLGITQ